MKSKLKPMLAASGALLVAISLATVSVAAQQSRPRYASTQSGEQSWTLPADTVLSVQINGTLSSRTAHVGDKFTATVTVPAYVNGVSVIPAGTIVEGRVNEVTPAKSTNRSSRNR